MLFTVALALCALFAPVASQFSGGDDDAFASTTFQPDPLTGGLFAILVIFGVAYSALLIWTFIALITSRGHRAPYAILFPTILFSGWGNAAYVGEIIIDNIPSLHFFSDTLPVLLIPSLIFILNLFSDWATVLLFLATIAVILNRETALKTASEGKSGGHNPVLLVVHIVLATLAFIFGTATDAYAMDTNVKIANGSFTGRIGRLERVHRTQVIQQLSYAFASWSVLLGVDIAVTTLLLWRSWRSAGISDKITNVMLYAVAPLYMLLSLFIMIFTIIWSPKGPIYAKRFASFEVFEKASESANLANSLLVTGTSIAIMITLLVMSAKKTFWNIGGAEPTGKYVYQTQPWPVQQQYMQQQYAYAQPLPAQPGFYNPNAPTTQPYVQSHEYPQSHDGSSVQFSPQQLHNPNLQHSPNSTPHMVS
ncbi:hypothetical protein C8J57DRAFT_212487 [Mycena rebaudengoi]|nr:hypothetical protein C8J57DRAFT_212487 [Mycena rebaudengoi]